jgi:putative lipoic acid-binding regulatory protein
MHSVADDEQLLEFPCTLTLKVIGTDEAGFSDWVVATLSAHCDGVDSGSVSTRPSRNGRYLSVAVTLRLDSRDQLETLHRTLGADERVAYVL